MLNLFLSKHETVHTSRCDSPAPLSGLASPASKESRSEIGWNSTNTKLWTMEKPAERSFSSSPVDSLSCTLKSPGELKHYPLDRKLWR